MSAEKTAIPIPTIQPTTTPLLKILWRVYGYLRPYWKQTLAAYLSLFVILGLNMLIPQFIRWIIDTGIDGNRPDVLTWSVVALLGLTLIKGVLNYINGTQSEMVARNVACDLGNEIHRMLNH